MNNNENPMELNDSELSEVNGGFSLGRKRLNNKKVNKAEGSANKNASADKTGSNGTTISFNLR